MSTDTDPSRPTLMILVMVSSACWEVWSEHQIRPVTWFLHHTVVASYGLNFETHIQSLYAENKAQEQSQQVVCIQSISFLSLWFVVCFALIWFCISKSSVLYSNAACRYYHQVSSPLSHAFLVRVLTKLMSDHVKIQICTAPHTTQLWKFLEVKSNAKVTLACG